MALKAPSNIVYSLLSNISNTVLPMVTMSFATHAIGVESYGKYIHASVFSNWIIAISISSLGSFFIRELVESKNEGQTVSDLLSAQIGLSLISVIVHAAILCFVAGLWFEWVYTIFLPVTLFSFLNVDWYFYAKNNLGVLFWRSLFVKLLCVALVIVFVRDKNDMILFAIIMASMTVVSNLFGFAFIVVKEKPRVNFNNFKKLLMTGRYFFANAGVGSIYQFADQVILGAITLKSELAYLSIYKQIISGAVSFPGAVCRVLIKSSTEAVSNKSFASFIWPAMKKYLLALVAMSVVFFCAAGKVVQVISNTRQPFITEAAIYGALCFIIVSLNVFIDTQISIPSRREHITTRANISVATIASVLMPFLLPAYGYRGGIITLTVSELAGLLTMIFLHIKAETLRNER